MKNLQIQFLLIPFLDWRDGVTIDHKKFGNISNFLKKRTDLWKYPFWANGPIWIYSDIWITNVSKFLPNVSNFFNCP